MIPFGREFFQGEERDGFYIEPMMKCIWAAEMEVLSEINQICINHDLHWFAGWGTLLGAARHKGFIPWDDDMDIFMFRSDYNKLIHFAEKELPPGFELLSPYTSDNWDQTHCLINNSVNSDYSLEHLAAYHACPLAVGVDIFPLDALPSGPEGDALCTLCSALLYHSRQLSVDPAEVLDALPTLEEACCAKFDPGDNLKNQLLRAADKVCQCYDISECDCVTQYTIHALRPIALPKIWFAETIRLPFENIMMPAPKDYDNVLTVLYGDWRTPVKTSQHSVFQQKRARLNAEIAARIARGETIF